MSRRKPTGPTWPTSALVAKMGTQAATCRRLGIKPRHLKRDLTDVQADRWATRCGFHPEQVWPGWCDAGLRYVDRVFVEQGGWRHAWLHHDQAQQTDGHQEAAA